jgi:hypothetical protein
MSPKSQTGLQILAASLCAALSAACGSSSATNKGNIASIGAGGTVASGGGTSTGGTKQDGGGMTSTGIAYYVSDCQTGADAHCVAGNDANAGTDPAAPWQTFAHAMDQFGSLPGGAQILLARGGSFIGGDPSGTRQLSNFNASPSSPITVADYTPSWAPANVKVPYIDSTADTIGAFYFSEGGNADADGGYIIRNLEIKGGGAASSGIVMWNDVNDVLIDNLDIHDFGIGVNSAGSNAPNAGSNALNDRITLSNCYIHDNPSWGFGGGANDLIIENSRFWNNGFAEAIFDHNVYVAGHVENGHSGISNVTVRGNDLYHNSIINGQPSSVSLVVHGVVANLLIEGNTVREDADNTTPTSCGIEVDPGLYGTLEGFTNAVIRGNKVINAGGGGIGATSAPGIVIENNVVIFDNPTGAQGITIPDRARPSIALADNQATIRNNSIYFGNAATGVKGIVLNTEGSGHTVVSNAIYFSANSGSSGFSCFDTTGLTAAQFSAFDYNVCYFPNASGAMWEVNAGSLASWQANSGFDTHSIQADPQYNSPGAPNYDLTIPSTSPAVNAGSPTLSAPTDFTNATRDAHPDMGAYEYR